MGLLDSLRDRLSREKHRPLLPSVPDGRWWAERTLSHEILERVDSLALDDRGHGVDAFGASREGIAFVLALMLPLYRRYFRVISHGLERLPTQGPVVLAVNHSGLIPLDAMMLAVDLLLHAPGGRVPKVVGDYFIPNLPWFNILFARGGGISGSRGNVHAVLDHDGLLMVFPEGTVGIGKPFSERYQLKPFREGFAELAIRHQATVVPAAVVGAEESWPQAFRVDALKMFGAPFMPIPALPLPLPARFHLYYGEPIDVPGRYEPHQSIEGEVVSALAAEVQDAVQGLIDEGLAAREGVFT